MSYETRRNKFIELMKPNSMLVLYSGIEVHISSDDYEPFKANRNFFYLTGLTRDNMCLVLIKEKDVQVKLFIEEPTEFKERWLGHRLTKNEARKISGIQDVEYIEDIDRHIDSFITYNSIQTVYFDIWKNNEEDMDDYNHIMAQDFAFTYEEEENMEMEDAFPLFIKLRSSKDEDEVALTKKAIGITNTALKHVLDTLKPGMMEYQVQAEFEYKIKYEGADCVAFTTIAGSGKNATMLHYHENKDVCEDGNLILLDLGARYKGYNADITRTYPINGTFSERQKAVYDIVLAANMKIKEVAKAGMSLIDLNEVCKDVLATGCIQLGLIKNKNEIGKYYMHSVSHHLGIDVHDINDDRKAPLPAGAIISDEPGLYIDEWGIGIRIEDDLLITEDGCVCLSEDIIRTTEDIEAYMKGNK